MRNPVHSVMMLILAFFSAAGLFVLLGAEYIAMTLIVVYVGAVAILFLFVVMMLNINVAGARQGFLRYMPLGIGVALFAFLELFAAFKASSIINAETVAAASPTPAPSDISNTVAIGNILYTDYIYPFQIAGVILLVAMVGAIVLTLRVRKGVRKQNISEQIARRRGDAIRMVDVKSGSGI